MKRLLNDVIRNTNLEKLPQIVAEVFDEQDPIAQAQLWAENRAQAKRMQLAKEFDKLYTEYKRHMKSETPAHGNADSAVAETGIQLETDRYGRPCNSADNFIRILSLDPKFTGLWYDEFESTVRNGRAKWTDRDDAEARVYIERKYKISAPAKLLDAISVVSAARQHHPLRDLIDGIKWDGKSRIYTMLAKWLKCEDTEYTREVSRLIFAGGINRIYNPGCKFDLVPVLIGLHQGEGKSTFVNALAMNDDYFAEITTIDGKEGVENLQGKWICELSELMALNRVKDQEAVKSYVSRRVDHYRAAYGRNSEDIPRQCIFIGTTNRAEFLADKTGGRRFLPVTANSNGCDLFANMAELKNDIMQCWAEARFLYSAGKLPTSENVEVLADIKAAQEEAAEDDYRTADIAKFLESQPIGAHVCIKQLWIYALGMRDDVEIPYASSRAIGSIMQSMPGWARDGRHIMPGFGRVRTWKRVSKQQC